MKEGERKNKEREREREKNGNTTTDFSHAPLNNKYLRWVSALEVQNASQHHFAVRGGPCKGHNRESLIPLCMNEAEVFRYAANWPGGPKSIFTFVHSKTSMIQITTPKDEKKGISVSLYRPHCIMGQCKYVLIECDHEVYN